MMARPMGKHRQWPLLPKYQAPNDRWHFAAALAALWLMLAATF